MKKPYSKILIDAYNTLSDESKWLKDGSYFNNCFFTKPDDPGELICMCGIGAAILNNQEEFTCKDTGLITLTDSFADFLYWVDKKVYELTDKEFRSFFNFNDDPNTSFQQLKEMLLNLSYEAIREDV